MSSHALWLLVEGPIDRAVYSKICAHNTDLTSVDCRIIISKELPGFQGEGKRVLLDYYRYLRSRNSLFNTLSGKRTAILVFLDKDVDDRRRTLARSDHVRYTEWYSLENYLFREGNIQS